MRIFGGFVLALLLATVSFAQGYRGGYFNPQPVLTGGFGNVVFPGGTSATTPGIQRFTPNVAFPGGGGPYLNVPASNQSGAPLFPSFGIPSLGTPAGARRPRRPYTGSIYAMPVYVGGGYGYYGGNYYDSPYPPDAAAGAPAPQPPNVIVIYPQTQPQPSAYASEPPQAGLTQPYEESATPAAGEPAHYLIAFKDHTIYSAVAYWVDGDTLHYFTTGNTHNQVSLSLVDRDLTERLNREAGTDLHLPR